MLEFLSSFFDKFHSLILVSLTNVSYVFCILSLCRIPNHIGSIFDCNSSSLKKILLKKQKNDSFLFIYTKKKTLLGYFLGNKKFSNQLHLIPKEHF